MTTSSADADNGSYLSVYFAEGPTLSKWVKRLGWSWFRRHPLTLWEMLGSEVIARAWGTRCRHVLLEHGGGVLDYQFCRIQYYPLDSFLQGYPGVIGHFRVPQADSVDLTEKLPDRSHFLQAFLTSLHYYAMFLSCGLYQPRTCVSVASEALSKCGVQTPRSVWSPPRLAWWLLEQGYEWIPENPADDVCGPGRADA